MAPPTTALALTLLRVTAAASGEPPKATVYWDFSDSSAPFKDKISGYQLVQHNATHPVELVPAAAPFATAAAFGFATAHEPYPGADGNRLWAGRETVPKLAAIEGPSAQVSVVVWVQVGPGERPQHGMSGGGFVGGVWEESESWRQWAIFMDHTGSCKAKNGLVAHISPEGAPSPGQKYCESRACGETALQPHAWHCLGNVYDGHAVRAYVNGTLDTNSSIDPNNPFSLPDPPRFPNGGIFKPPAGGGANFSIGANFVHPGGGKGAAILSNKFVGLLGGFAVWDRALTRPEVAEVCATPHHGAWHAPQ